MVSEGTGRGAEVCLGTNIGRRRRMRATFHGFPRLPCLVVYQLSRCHATCQTALIIDDCDRTKCAPFINDRHVGRLLWRSVPVRFRPRGHRRREGGRGADGLPLSISVAAIYGSRLHLVKVTPSGVGPRRRPLNRSPSASMR